MKLFIVAAAAIVSLVALSSPALAQERVPYAGGTAAGFDIGAFIPRSDELASSVLLNGTYEFYITPRISVRAGVGWWNPGFSIGAVDSARGCSFLNHE